MAGILGRAKGMLAGRKASPPRPFATRCVCGEVLEGYRQPEFQVLTCPACGTSLFVFPQSPLVEPDAPLKKGRARAKGKSETDSGGVSEVAERVPPVPRKPVAERVRDAARERGRKLRGIFRGPSAILAGVVLLVLMTGWWQWRASELRRLREELDPSGRRGLQALADGDLELAWDELCQAVHAMDRLGERVPDGEKYRQARAELAIARDLLEESLEFELTGGTKSPDAVSRRIRGRAMVLDAVVEPGESEGWIVHATCFMDDETVRIDTDGFQLFEPLGIESKTRLIFGARLEGLAKDSAGRWAIRWLPGSGVLITEPALLDRLGLSADPETATVREYQRSKVYHREESATPSAE